MPSRPGYYAVPGSIWPGDMWPAKAGALAFSATGAVFSLGEPYLDWAAGSAYADWDTQEPYLEWAAGQPYTA